MAQGLGCPFTVCGLLPGDLGRGGHHGGAKLLTQGGWEAGYCIPASPLVGPAPQPLLLRVSPPSHHTSCSPALNAGAIGALKDPSPSLGVVGPPSVPQDVGKS